MECIYLIDAQYKKDYRILLKFNTGESGEVDLEKIISEHKIAEPLQDKKIFSDFYLDTWPTLAWKCGFDIAPEYLYSLAISKPDVSAIS